MIYSVIRKCKQLIHTNAQISRIRWKTSKVTLHWVTLCYSRTASFQICLYFPLQQSPHFNTWSPQMAMQSRWRNDLLLSGGCDGIGLSLYIGGIHKNPCRYNRAGVHGLGTSQTHKIPKFVLGSLRTGYLLLTEGHILDPCYRDLGVTSQMIIGGGSELRVICATALYRN